MIYKPDKWLVLKIHLTDSYHYRVFGTWSGGYLDGDSWRLNSGIVSVTKPLNRFIFHGNTGSSYSCHEEMYGVAGAYNHGELEQILKQFNAEVMPENTDWLKLEYTDV